MASLRIASFPSLLCGCALVLCAVQARSTSIDRVPLEGVVGEAAIVARVRLTNRSEVPCGSIFTATVIEQFKGEAESFSFFATSDAGFAGFDPEYLVVVNARTDDQLAALRDNASFSVDESEKKRLLCMLQEKYFVKSHIQMLIPFIRDSGDPSKEWLQTSRMSIISENRFHQTSGVHGETLVSWADVERVLRGVETRDPKAVQGTDPSRAR